VDNPTISSNPKSSFCTQIDLADTKRKKLKDHLGLALFGDEELDVRWFTNTVMNPLHCPIVANADTVGEAVEFDFSPVQQQDEKGEDITVDTAYPRMAPGIILSHNLKLQISEARFRLRLTSHSVRNRSIRSIQPRTRLKLFSRPLPLIQTRSHRCSTSWKPSP
jgi:hypothetical protein